MVKVHVLSAVSRGCDVTNCSGEIASSTTVAQVLNNVAEAVKLKVADIELRHCGRALPSDSTFEALSIGDNHSVHVVRNHKAQAMPIHFDRSRVAVGVHSSIPQGKVQTVLREFTRPWGPGDHGNQRTKLINVLWDHEFISSVIQSIPQLQEDVVSQRILRDPFVLRNIIFNSRDRSLICAHHPGLILGLDAVMKKVAGLTQPYPPSFKAAHAPINDAAESEDEDEAMDDDQPAAPRQPRPMITAAQLAAAMAGAGQANPQPQAAAQNAQPAGVTPAMLQSVMANMFGAAQTAQAQQMQQQPAAPAAVSAARLATLGEELVSMGFVDIAANKAALVQAGGDITQAIDILVNQRQSQFDLD